MERPRNFSLFSARAAKLLQKISKPLVSLVFFVCFFRNGFRKILPIGPYMGLGTLGGASRTDEHRDRAEETPGVKRGRR